MASGQRPQGLLHRGQRWRPGAGRWGGAGRGGVGGASSGSSSRPGAPPGARTHSVRTARRCSSWSRAGSRCSLGLRSGAGAPCTRGCASGHTQCCRLTTCSTPSTLRPLQEHSTRHVGHRRAQVCAQSTAVHAHARTHTTAGGEPRAHSGAHTHTHTHTHSSRTGAQDTEATRRDPSTHGHMAPCQRSQGHRAGREDTNRHRRPLTQAQPGAPAKTQTQGKYTTWFTQTWKGRDKTRRAQTHRRARAD